MSNKDGYISDYLQLRENVCNFLTFLKRILFEICIQCKAVFTTTSFNDQSFCILVVQQIKALLLFVGRLSQLKPQLISLAINSDPKTSIHNYFHCCLDIWWTAVEVMYILDQSKTINLNDFSLIKEEIGTNVLCLQTIRLILYDLTVFSVNRFNSVEHTNKYHSLLLFDCLCVKEMYVLIRHVFSAINNNEVNDKFLELIVSNLNSVMNRESDENESIRDFKTMVCSSSSPEKPFLHYIWFVTNVVQTFNYSLTGELSDDQLISTSIPIILTKKISLLLKQNDSKSEECLSPVIYFCLDCIKLWKPTADLLLPFIEFFFRNLNKTHSIKTVEDLPLIQKSSVKWLQMVSELSSDRTNAFIDNSFNLFLSFMRKQLSSIFASCDSKTKLMNWQKFKGKAIVNIQKNKLEKLNHIGIYNLLTFYLVLLDTNQDIWTDLIDSTLEICSHFLDNGKYTELVFKFMFSLLQIKSKLVSDQKVCSFISDNYNKAFEHRIKNFVSDSVKKQFYALTSTYFEELTLLLKSNEFHNISYNKLVNIKFNAFSNNSVAIEEQLIVTNYISVLLDQINEFYEKERCDRPQMSSLVSVCFDQIYSFIKHEINRKKNDNILTEIAYSLTKLSNNGLVFQLLFLNQ